uniref:Uncharacterized protein n=1 Tax=Lotharella oceanica TaxID=641309 RepID=A0A7S2U1Y8_9EUKA
MKATSPLLHVTPRSSQQRGLLAGATLLVVTVLSFGAAAVYDRRGSNLLATKAAIRRVLKFGDPVSLKHHSPTAIRRGMKFGNPASLKPHSPTVSRCVNAHALVMPESVPRGSFSPKTLHHPTMTTKDRQLAVNSLFGLGLPELVVVGGIAALLFGPSKLPELGKALGQTAKSLGSAVKEFNEELKEEMQTDETEAPAASDSATAAKKEDVPPANKE